MTIHELDRISARFGLPLDGAALVCGAARISVWEPTGELCISTSDSRTAERLDNAGIGWLVLCKPSLGYLTCVFPVQRLGAIVEAVEGFRS
jgi:hypothetical protein